MLQARSDIGLDLVLQTQMRGLTEFRTPYYGIAKCVSKLLLFFQDYIYLVMVGIVRFFQDTISLSFPVSLVQKCRKKFASSRL